MNIYEIKEAIKSGQRIFDLPLRVTHYSRVSTDSTDQLNSLQAQTRYYNEFFDKYPQWVRVDGYVDEGITGTSTKKREDFNRMIEDAMSGKFDLILTKEVSRFARNTVDSLSYTRKLLDSGVGVFFQNDNICTLDSDGELRLTIMSSIAQEESRKISDRVKWGKQQSRNHGRVSGTNRIWGYDKDDGKLVINEKEAEMVRLIYSKYADGIGLRIIVKELTKLGYKSRSGKNFKEPTLSDILKNPKYKGWFVEGKTRVENYLTGKQKDIPINQWVMYPAPKLIPPIVSEEIWDKCNKILTERAKKVKRKETSYQNKFLYSGKLYCKKHNVVFWRRDTQSKKNNIPFWRCCESLQNGLNYCNAPLIYENELEYIVRDIIKQLKNNDEPIDNLISILIDSIEQVDYSKKIDEINEEL
jgi:site-specific DNA recombinase